MHSKQADPKRWACSGQAWQQHQRGHPFPVAARQLPGTAHPPSMPRSCSAVRPAAITWAWAGRLVSRTVSRMPAAWNSGATTRW